MADPTELAGPIDLDDPGATEPPAVPGTSGEPDTSVEPHPSADRDAPGVPPGRAPAPGERVTEIGPPELIDRGDHTRATIIGGVLLLLVFVVAVVGLGSLISQGGERGEVAQVVLPRFASRPMVDAQAELERLGLIVDVRFEPNEVAPPDTVVGQEPIAGARLEVGERVVLEVSDGPVGVRVPDLRGMQQGEAERTLEVLGLEIALRQIHDEVVPMGEIIRSDPANGARSGIGNIVTVAISLGPEPRSVPDVVGAPVPEGFATIGRSELEIAGVTERRVAGDQVGTILSTDPPAGAEVPRDQPIQVVVGVEAGPLDVPDVVGLTEANARGTLREQGFGARTRTEAVPAGDGRIGRVIRQTPIAGTPIGSGDDVTITVGVAAAPPPPPAPTTTTAASPPPTTAPP